MTATARPVVVRSVQSSGAKAVPGDAAVGVLNGSKPRVNACETPEFFARFGCPHRDGWDRVVFGEDETV